MRRNGGSCLWSDRKVVHDRIEDVVEVELLLSRCREDDSLRKLLLPPVHELEHLLLAADVDLVDHKDDRAVDLLKLSDVLVVLVTLLHGVGYIEDDVCVTDGGVHEVHHALLEPVVRLEDARSVGIDDLIVVSVHDTHDPVPCGLCLGSDDGKLFAYEGVHKRRFANIRITYDVDKSSAMSFVCFTHY